MNTTLSPLERELRASPPETLGRLQPEEIEHLAGAIRAAHQRQSRELAAAGDAAFNVIPRLLRGPIKKILR